MVKNKIDRFKVNFMILKHKIMLYLRFYDLTIKIRKAVKQLKVHRHWLHIITSLTTVNTAIVGIPSQSLQNVLLWTLNSLMTNFAQRFLLVLVEPSSFPILWLLFLVLFFFSVQDFHSQHYSVSRLYHFYVSVCVDNPFYQVSTGASRYKNKNAIKHLLTPKIQIRLSNRNHNYVLANTVMTDLWATMSWTC